MYEIALAEWKLTPEYLNENWTEELLALMFQKRYERLLPPKVTDTRLSNEEYFKKYNITVDKEL